FGETCPEGYYLPFPLTHAQIGSTIGSTRVTVTRLMGKLRQRGIISSYGDGLICLSGDMAIAPDALPAEAIGQEA
ncbi:MAG TPA: helix-turn-helix domain-containing protein, partial [Candidatus Obscuribacterales bacterium]